jgi:hypothetical protein
MTFKRQNKTFISDDVDEFGSISWFVESADYVKPKMKQRHTKSAELRITDCYKVITLDFEYCGHDNYSDRVRKVNNLIIELEEFKQSLVDSWGQE